MRPARPLGRRLPCREGRRGGRAARSGWPGPWAGRGGQARRLHLRGHVDRRQQGAAITERARDALHRSARRELHTRGGPARAFGALRARGSASTRARVARSASAWRPIGRTLVCDGMESADEPSLLESPGCDIVPGSASVSPCRSRSWSPADGRARANAPASRDVTCTGTAGAGIARPSASQGAARWLEGRALAGVGGRLEPDEGASDWTAALAIRKGHPSETASACHEPDPASAPSSPDCRSGPPIGPASPTLARGRGRANRDDSVGQAAGPNGSRGHPRRRQDAAP